MPGELDQIEADIIERDNRDMNREISRFARQKMQCWWTRLLWESKK